MNFNLSTGRYEDGALGEVFLDVAKDGTFLHEMMNAFAMCMSIGLQHDIPLSVFLHTFKDFGAKDSAVRKVFEILVKEEEVLNDGDA
jgi:hypothetical protein